MTTRVALIDAASAIAVAILVIVVSPGWAVVGIVAVLLLLGCAVSFVVGRGLRFRRSRAASRRRSRGGGIGA